jgi:hypothetical protein
MTQFGSLIGGAAQSSNNARNLVLQPFDPATGWVATTSVTFPGTTKNIVPLGQTAGLLVYQDDDHFIYVGRVFTPSGQSQIEFRQEDGANNELVNTVNETGLLNPTVFLRLVKTGNLYQAYYSYDNVTFTAIAPGLVPTATPTSTATATATATGTITPVTATATNTPVATATSTPTPIGYTANFTTPQFGVFAWGGTNSTVQQNAIPADFDWFRLGANSLTPVPTATATATNTPGPTSTSTPVTPTSTAVPATATATATSTATAVPTATSTPLPTDTPVPTPTPKPAKKFGFEYTSVWYRYIHVGNIQHIQMQDKSHSQDGIWVVVQFASGKPLRWYQNTDKHGFWQLNLKVPPYALTRESGRAVVTFQLWKGKRTTKTYETFYVIR